MRYLLELLEMESVYKHANCMPNERYLGVDHGWLAWVDFEAEGVA